MSNGMSLREIVYKTLTRVCGSRNLFNKAGWNDTLVILIFFWYLIKLAILKDNQN